MSNAYGNLIVLCAAFALSGCVSLLPEASAPATRYTLALKVSAKEPRPERFVARTLKVAFPLSEQTLRSPRVRILHEKEGTTQSDALADVLWSESLPDLVHRRLIQFLSEQRLFESVCHIDESVDADLLLIPTLETFGLHQTRAGEMRAHVSLTLKLVEPKTRKMLRTKIFSKDISITSPSQEKSMACLESAFHATLEEVREWFVHPQHPF